MSTFIGDVSEAAWSEHLAELREHWHRLAVRATELNERQLTELRILFSNVGLSAAEADDLIQKAVTEQDADPAATEGLAGILRRQNNADRVYPPSFEDATALLPRLVAEWERTLAHLSAVLDSERDKRLLDSRKKTQPADSLLAAVLAPVKEFAAMQDTSPEHDLASFATELEHGDKEKESCAGVVAELLYGSLKLKRVMDALDAAWTEGGAALTQSVPLPESSSPRIPWYAFWRKRQAALSTHSASDSQAFVWRDPLPEHHPSDRRRLNHLLDRRREADRDAASLKAADAALTNRVATIGSELLARQTSLQKHPECETGPVDTGQEEFSAALELAGAPYDGALRAASTAFSL